MKAPGDDAAARWLDRALAAVSFALPAAVAATRAASAPQWRDDFTLVRALGATGTGGTGAVTSLLVQLASLAPLGPLPFRAALVAALALGATSLLAYRHARRALLANVATPRLAALLAGAAALAVGLSPIGQREGTVGGGAAVAAALALAAIVSATGPARRDVRAWGARGALLGATAAESVQAAGLVLAALLLEQLLSRSRPKRRAVAVAALACAATLVPLLLPWALRPFAPRATVDLGRALGTLALTTPDVPLAQPSAVGAWIDEVGPLALAIAALGALFGLVRVRLRWAVGPALALVAADALFPVGTVGALSGDPLAPVRLLAVASIALLAAVGVQTAATLLLAVGTQPARVAAVLIVVFDLTLVGMASEAAAFSADRSGARGAEAFGDEALAALPPRSLLLVRSRAVAWRAWAERLASGARPDVLLVPEALLGRGRVAARLVEAEPAVAALLRDVASEGRASESALTQLADERPVFVEVDPGWERKADVHLASDRLWQRYAPEPLARSDRTVALAATQPAFDRVLAAATAGDQRDEATLAVLAARLRDQAAVSAMLGDRDATVATLGRLSAIATADPFVAELTRRLAAQRAGSIDVRSLLP